MKLTASHTINLGICKLTISKSGISVSSGIPGLRFGLNSKGQGRITAGIPGTGIKYQKTKKIV